MTGRSSIAVERGFDLAEALVDLLGNFVRVGVGFFKLFGLGAKRVARRGFLVRSEADARPKMWRRP